MADGEKLRYMLLALQNGCLNCLNSTHQIIGNFAHSQ